MNRTIRILCTLCGLVLIGSLALSAAPVVWRVLGYSGVVAPKPLDVQTTPQIATTKADLAPILAWAPFGAADVPAATNPAQATSTLDLTLKGVVMSQNAAQSLALIASSEGTKGYVSGDEIAQIATLRDVQNEFVTLDVNGETVVLSFREMVDPPPKPEGLTFADIMAKPSAKKEAPARSEPETTQDYIDLWRDRIAANPGQVLQAIGLIATDKGYIIADKHDIGVKLAGLKAGDLVARVNGQTVGDVEKDRKFYDEIAAAGIARLEIQRNGKTIKMSFPLN